MILRVLPLVAGLVPVLTVTVSYMISIETAGIPSCNPFLDGCTSVSSTGRHEPASYLFKGLMMPQAIVLSAYWLLNVGLLRALERARGGDADAGTAIGVVGVTGSLFLILYVTFLGSEVPFYEFMRRYGVYLYFALNVVAQLMLVYRILPFAREWPGGTFLRVARLQLFLAWVPFAMGILNLVLKATLEESRPAENRIEWTFALLMQAYFLLTYWSWRETQFSARFEVARQGSA